MPLYEYECSRCQKVHEVMQKFSDTPLVECPECSAPVQRLISRTSFSLKGKGWYTTDYKKNSAPKVDTNEKKEAPKESPPASVITKETKPSTPSSGTPS